MPRELPPSAWTSLGNVWRAWAMVRPAADPAASVAPAVAEGLGAVSSPSSPSRSGSRHRVHVLGAARVAALLGGARVCRSGEARPRRPPREMHSCPCSGSRRSDSAVPGRRTPDTERQLRSRCGCTRDMCRSRPPALAGPPRCGRARPRCLRAPRHQMDAPPARASGRARAARVGWGVRSSARHACTARRWPRVQRRDPPRRSGAPRSSRTAPPGRSLRAAR